MSDTLMISVAGTRGHVGTDLTPELVARQAAALGAWVRARGGQRVVIGRDSRTSGAMFTRAACAGFESVGLEVIDVGVVPTPTVQLAVEYHHAGAGLILTASHNPIVWNGLKFLGSDGIFLDAVAGAEVRALADRGPERAGWDGIGTVREDPDAVARHLDAILALPEIDADAIRARGFHVAIDTVHGAGGPIIQALLERLGVRVSGIGLTPDGRFPREPEPLPEHLGDLGDLVRRVGADVGMAIDPDADRLALVDETGTPIGEDYTLALAVGAVLARHSGSAPVVVANLSTSLVVEDAAVRGGGVFQRAPVGEANVAAMIQSSGALIGGEGNGGVILPALHVGRDAPLAAALVLQELTRHGEPLSQQIGSRPRYVIVKAKVPRGGELTPLYQRLREVFPDAAVDTRDGLRLAWSDRWLHVRPSGTEPIVRLIAEAPTRDEADAMIARARDAR